MNGDKVLINGAWGEPRDRRGRASERVLASGEALAELHVRERQPAARRVDERREYVEALLREREGNVAHGRPVDEIDAELHANGFDPAELEEAGQ